MGTITFLNESLDILNQTIYDWSQDAEATTVEQGYAVEQIFALHRPITLLIHKVITILWWCIGFPGNILAFVVWIQPRMRPSSGTYMAALAMTDLIFLFFHVLFELQSSWHIRTVEFQFLCQVFPVVYLSSQYLSVLLVGAFTVERYISICHPFEREKFCTIRRPLLCVMTLALFALGLNVVQAYFWNYDSNKRECGIRPEVFFSQPSVWQIWSWLTELLIFLIVPIAILVLNILVLVEMRRIKAKQPPIISQASVSLRRSRSTQSRHRSGGPSATTLMLLAVSFYLILVTLPVTLTYVLVALFPAGNSSLTLNETLSDPTWQNYCSFWSVKVFIQDTGLSHFALNFYIYLAAGQVFRRELLRLCKRCHCGCFVRIKQIFCKRRPTSLQDIEAHRNSRPISSRSGSFRNRTEIVSDNGNGTSLSKF